MCVGGRGAGIQSVPAPSPHSRQAFNPFPAAAMSNNMAKIAEARKTVEQLKLEVNIDRMKVRRPTDGETG